jgi:uncharacterized protein YjiS (DUF1127 family)
MEPSMDLSKHLIAPLRAPFRLIGTLLSAMALQRHRRRLHALNDDLLDDIGLTRKDAISEANRPIWDVPSHWRL